MLTELKITDFAIIDDLHLDLLPGFNVLTGETGAGKSIVLDAVTLLLGERAELSVIRAGCDSAYIEGVFHLKDPDLRARVTEVLEREEIESENPEFLIVSREVRSNGRSVARVNGVSATLSVLQDIGEHLVDIHGQSDYLSLLKPSSHLPLLDRYGGLTAERHAFSELVAEVDRIRAELIDLRSNEEQRQRRADMLAYQVEELKAAELKPGEGETLQDEARRLGSSEQLAALSAEAYMALMEASEGGLPAVELLNQAALAVSRLVKFDPDVTDLAELADTVSIQAEELARSLSDYQEKVEFDPLRLQQVEMRLDMINALKRKHDAESIEQLLLIAEEAAAELENIEGSSERIEQLFAEEARMLKKIAEAGLALSRKRSKVADKLARAIEQELADLRMADARFGISMEQVPHTNGAPIGDERIAFDRTGIDRVEFLIAPNIGEPLHPMAKIASGGETSRIMLALKTVLGHADQTPTLIFDEIDAGIGGRLGAIVGQKLWSLSVDHQVLVVTHLPQLAGFADGHFKVEKHTSDKRTVTHVFQLDGDAQVEELTEMLGPEAESARQSAQDILRYVEQVKAGTPAAG